MELIYQYDGTFDGFLCCIYHSYVDKEIPAAIESGEAYLSLYEVRQIHTVRENAQRVYRSIVKRSHSAADILRRTFFTCLENKELCLLRYVQKLYAEGPGFLANASDPVCYPIFKALRHMSGELEKLRGFIRFSDYNGILGAEIEPKNHVLPLLRRHFCERYANESFFLYDRTHQELLLYAGGRSRIAHVEQLYLEQPGETEILCRTLWKKFYETVAIESRVNPRCQNTFLPKRYRSVMTEFLPAENGLCQDFSQSIDALSLQP